MKGKITCLIVSGLMTLSLVIAACAPKVVEKPEVTEKPKPEVVEKPAVVEPVAEKPKYGGVLKLERAPADWGVGGPGNHAEQLTNQSLWDGDWARGPAGGYGTNETDWSETVDIWYLNKGYVAESWEFPTKLEGETATVIWHIRKGVHFALNPESEASRLVGGREVTADDVVASIKRVVTTPVTHVYRSNPELKGEVVKITALDKYTVKMEIPWELFQVAIFRLTIHTQVWASEVLAKYGGDMNKWYLSVGTGPFILTSYVPDSTATFVRNPNYWEKDPVGPGKGNQLPYLDGVKFFVIPDLSTHMAAMRTGKLDYTGGTKGLPWLEATALKKQVPQLKMKTVMRGHGGGNAWRLDMPPFNDIRVRRALMMATDFESIKRDMFAGQAAIVTLPMYPSTMLPDAYYGPDPETGVWPADAPESIKELYVYNPEKAKQLLAEAGYPNGFKTHAIMANNAQTIDYMSVIKDMWRKVGVDLELRPLESAALAALRNRFDYEQIWVGNLGGTLKIYQLDTMYGQGIQNLSIVDDPEINELYPKIQRAVAIGDYRTANQMVRSAHKKFLEQVWGFPEVNPYKYTMWWPWLKNYSGELSLGWKHRHVFQYVWIDQELKKQMGY